MVINKTDKGLPILILDGEVIGFDASAVRHFGEQVQRNRESLSSERGKEIEDEVKTDMANFAIDSLFATRKRLKKAKAEGRLAQEEDAVIGEFERRRVELIARELNVPLLHSVKAE